MALEGGSLSGACEGWVEIVEVKVADVVGVLEDNRFEKGVSTRLCRWCIFCLGGGVASGAYGGS